jgi:hypothetical protein
VPTQKRFASVQEGVQYYQRFASIRLLRTLRKKPSEGMSPLARSGATGSAKG